MIVDLHRKSPEILAASIIETRLDDVGQGSQVGTSVSVDNTLGTRSCSRGEGNSQHIILTPGLSMETCPALAALINVMLQTLENGFVKGTA